MEHGIFTRRPGLGLAEVASGLDVWAIRGPPVAAKLNPTAALVFLLCDGALSVSEIAATVAREFPEAHDQVYSDVLAVVGELRGGQLLIEASDTAPPRPIYRVHFSYFWHGFSFRNNYIMLALSYFYDPLLIDNSFAPKSAIDFSIFSHFVDPNAVSAESRFAIFVSFGSELPHDMLSPDFVLTASSETQTGTRALYIPAWAHFIDWAAYDLADPHVPAAQRFPHAFHPQRAAETLFRALELATDTPEHHGGPSAAVAKSQAPDPSRSPARRATLAPPPRSTKPLLTVGMATYDDFDGIYFTVQALRLYHAECLSDLEIVVIDNDPDGPSGKATRRFLQRLPECRYLPFTDYSSTCVKDLVFRVAAADHVLCLDSHVFLFPGSVLKLIEYFCEHPEYSALLHGPLANDELTGFCIEWNPPWRKAGAARWAPQQMDPEQEPLEIDVHYTGVFACRRDAWLGFSPRFTGFGEEEGYIQEKFRQAGRKVLSLPFLKWAHRFGPHPKGVPYALSYKDRFRNLMLGHWELGIDPEPVKRFWRPQLGPSAFQALLEEVEHEGRSGFFSFEVAYYLDFDGAPWHWAAAQQRLKALGVYRPRRLLADDVDPSLRRIEAHRDVLAFAWKAGYASVVLFEDVNGCPPTAEAVADRSAAGLPEADWDVWILASDQGTAGSGDRPISAVRTHAIAYHRRCFESVLGALAALDRSATDRAALEQCLQGACPAIRRCVLDRSSV